jgi:hypothetical protein
VGDAAQRVRRRRPAGAAERAAAGAIAVALGVHWRPALVFGLGLALSSTAVGLQMLAERKELQSPHGRLGFAILLFQDLAAIPLLALIPLLAAPPPTAAWRDRYGRRPARDRHHRRWWSAAAAAAATVPRRGLGRRCRKCSPPPRCWWWSAPPG